MIVMDIKLDNFLAFKDFHMNMSYPKKILNSFIEDEYLENYPNFRYKKVNILMGANATGKTSFGRMLMSIFNFIARKQYESLTKNICDKSKKASFSLDIVGRKDTLYRIKTDVFPTQNREYTTKEIQVVVKQAKIRLNDSYESCVKRLEQDSQSNAGNYVEELEKVKGLSWSFQYPNDSKKLCILEDNDKYLMILENVLKALDPAIKKVEKIEDVENAYVIRTTEQQIVIQDGKMANADLLSSGTIAGIEIAAMLADIMSGEVTFYYCDEKFSYIHTEIEQAVLSVMIQSLHKNDQLFFTTHNTDILELALPKHSFTFLRKSINNDKMPIECVDASDFLKRNTDSLKNAVANDLFSTAPSTDLIYNLADM